VPRCICVAITAEMRAASRVMSTATTSASRNGMTTPLLVSSSMISIEIGAPRVEARTVQRFAGSRT
jgi:hypothetical protein